MRRPDLHADNLFIKPERNVRRQSCIMMSNVCQKYVMTSNSSSWLKIERHDVNSYTMA